MILYNKFGIPDNFRDLLPELKARTLLWEKVCHSGTDINSSATVSYYAANVTNPYGNIILSPGLATNTDIDPLMKLLIFWALSNKYNVFTFNTFLGNFQNAPSFEQAKNNTYTEFVTLLEICIKLTAQYSMNQTNIIVGHSAGAAGITDALNSIASKNEKNNINSVLLFAPWLCLEWRDYIKEVIYKRSISNKFDNPHNILPFTNIFDMQETGTNRYISVLPKFLDDMCTSPFRPDLMSKWDTHITIVAGEKDKKSPPYLVQKRYKELKKYRNKKHLKFVLLSGAKHNFLNVYQRKRSVITLIKSQRRYH